MLTPILKDTLDFIIDYQMKTGGVSPSYQEIMEHFDLGSKGSVARRVRLLIERGQITKTPHVERSLVVVSKAPQYFKFNTKTKELERV